MNNIAFWVWLLPILFMLHDFEEIIMAEAWGNRYQTKINRIWPKRQPFGLKYVHKSYQTAAFSIGVEVIFLFYALISFFSVLFNNYFLWYAIMIGLLLHFIFLHIIMSIRFKNYVPGVITSILFLFPNGWILYYAQKILHYSIPTILLACATVVALAVILFPILHKSMGSWSKWIEKYSARTSNNI